MSNWLKSKCDTIENLEAEAMNEAFARMGLTLDFSTKEVERTYESDKRPCQALLRNAGDNSSARIGVNFTVKQVDGESKVSMALEADWWGMKYNSKSFLEQFTKEYIAAKSINTMRKQGYTVREEVELKDGRRKLVMAKAA